MSDHIASTDESSSEVSEEHRKRYAYLGADYIANASGWELGQIFQGLMMIDLLPKKDRDILLYYHFCHDDDYDGIGTDDLKARLTARDPDWKESIKRSYANGL